jgi:hypothetical protein
MKSIISFPARGQWGQSSWRGNCSGYVQKELIEHFKPRLFVDVCEGSGTSRDVCKELGIEYRGFDLHTGTDFTADYILGKLESPADMLFSHPPYGRMIDYTEIGQFKDPSLKTRDTSVCSSVEEFLEKSRIMLLNQREATRVGGHYTSLIGDCRSKGAFRSFQSDFIEMMPKSELASVVIKTQHNCVSDTRQYNGNFVPILHEYLLIWKRSTATLVQVNITGLKEIKTQIGRTWRSLIRVALMRLGGKAKLDDIYNEIAETAEDRLSANPTWQATIRRTLQQHFEAVQRGVWAVPA